MTKYVDGSRISFDSSYTEMSALFTSRQRHPELNPVRKMAFNGNPTSEWLYRLSYSPAEGNKVNGIPTKDIVWTPELTAFIRSLTGGVKFAQIYEAAKKEISAEDRRRRAEYVRNKPDRNPYEL